MAFPSRQLGGGDQFQGTLLAFTNAMGEGAFTLWMRKGYRGKHQSSTIWKTINNDDEYSLRGLPLLWPKISKEFEVD